MNVSAQVASARPQCVDDALRAPGVPLSEPARVMMESRFHHDFSRVRVHSDASSANAVRANAFTVGEHIVFDSAIDPASARGRRLLAHELTHVVQQSRGGPLPLSLPSSATEREAARIADLPFDARADVREARGVGLARDPRSLNSTVDFSTLDDASLVHEMNELRRWLDANRAPSADRNLANQAMARAGAELQRRHPSPPDSAATAQQPGLPSAPPLAAGMLTTVGRSVARPPLPPSIVAPQALAQAGTAAEEAVAVGARTTLGSGATVAEGTATTVGRTAGTTLGRGAGLGLGATAAAVFAGLVVLLWPRDSIVSGAEEQRMLEEARRRRRQATGESSEAAPQADVQPETQSRPREQEDCMRQNHASPCSGSSAEGRARAYTGLDWSCEPFSSFGPGQMYDCGGAPGVVYHCTTPQANYVLSVIGCLCCNPDGSTGYDFVSAHQSSEDTGRPPQDRTRGDQRRRQERDRQRRDRDQDDE